MVDPTWTKTCPCGAEVSVNMLGQHLHTDCDYDPLSPGCCEDPQVTRLFYWTPDPGTRCENCGETWLGPLKDRVEAMASRLVDDWNIERAARGEIYRSNLRAITPEIDGATPSGVDA